MLRRTFSFAVWCLALAVIGAGDPALGDSVDWPLIGITQVTTNTFIALTCVTHAGDGSQRLFVVEQNGRVWIIQGNNLLMQPFLDITDRVRRASEQGLLGLAFPPGFATNGHFYVDYTRQPDGATVISRFRLTPDANVADANSEEILKIIPQPFPNHNGGQLAFGPDGYLYIAMGDGGWILSSGIGDPYSNAQNPGSLLGKLLRIDVESGTSPYAIPKNNPFVTNANYAAEIWALGLRNPWRFSFDRLTGDLYIGDVGHSRWEEIDFQPAGSPGGQNYGWRVLEGPAPYIVPPGFDLSTLTPPVSAYDHLSIPADGMAAVIGGYVYRGPSEPRMDGVYFFGDYESAQVWGLKRAGTNWQRFELFRGPFANFPISTFGEDDQGRLYLGVYANVYLNDYSGGRIFQVQDSHQVWTPMFLPPNGVVNSNNVAVTCVTTGAVIHYTTNGQDPSESDPSVLSGGTVLVVNGATNKLRAFRADLIPSAVATAVFTQKVGLPSFTPDRPTVVYGQPVTITTVTPNATIYFTLDGTDPVTNSMVYSAPLLFNAFTTLKARAYLDGFVPSDVGTIAYSLWNPQNAVVTTLAGSSTAGFSNAMGVLAKFSSPQGICVDRFGNLFIADTGNHVIRKLSPSGEVTTLAGTGVAGFQNGPATSAQFSGPTGVCVDSVGNVYVADTGNQCDPIRKIDTNYTVTTLVKLNSLCYGIPHLWQLTVDAAGNLYIGDSGTVQTISPDGTVKQLAGSGGNCYNGWCANVGPAIDAITNIYAATEYRIWKVAPAGSTVLYAGSGHGNSDGPRLLALFQGPQDAAVDSATNVLVSDITCIRKIGADGWVSTLAGTGVSGYVNGLGSVAQFNNAAGLCLDGQGNVYVADSGNNCIRMVSAGSVGPPSLQIALSANRAILSWPLWATGFVLETSSSLAPSAAWARLTNGVVTSVNDFVLTNQIGGENAFYRLHQP